MSGELVAQFEKRFRGGPAIRADLRVPAAGFSVTVLFGPSGSGKSTILRALAGLERPDAGVIRLDDQVWFDSARRLIRSPQQRGIGFLFQDYALFPHLTVQRNIGFGLGKVAASERRRMVREMLDRFGLGGLADRYPHQLSGGQQQRVALARVLVCRPRLLLLDEPLSALDASLREELRLELRRLIADAGVPVILVTHDRFEAIALADRVAVLDAGVIRQVGSVSEVFSRPVDVAVARIVGVESVLTGCIRTVQGGLATVSIDGVELTAIAPAHGGSDVYVCVRAEDVILQRGAGEPMSVRNRLAGRVRLLQAEGPMVRVELDCGFPLTALVTRSACEELGLHEADAITALVKAPAVHLIPRG